MGDGKKETLYWVALSMVPGIGPVLFKRLLSRFEDLERVFKASIPSLKEVEGIGDRLATEIRSFGRWEDAEEELAKAERYGAAIVTMVDSMYPKNLLNIYDPPPYLYVKGQLNGEERSIAVVGSRFASTYGKITTEGLSRDLAKNGLTVVSGMARGIDTAAHKGAMAAGGRTVAVLGSGIDVVYPPENRKLYEEICRHGAVVSELPMGTEPLSENFPARNRIISGISLGVVIVEASLRSGSLITASCAAEQGRDVFAVPGNINSNGSKGTNRLIKEGAKLVEGAGDILDEFSAVPASFGMTVDLSRDEKTVMGVLAEPVHIDEVASLSGMDVRSVSAILLNLELSVAIRQLPGMVFVKNI
ncbi:MAG: dprA [Deltaproteobacteria bacterium]|nr:dprA [Deltaproteobacteria bacterium]